MFDSVKKFLMEDVGEDIVVDDVDGIEGKAEKENEKIQENIARRIFIFMFLAILIFIVMFFYCDVGQLQRYGAVLSIVGIISEFVIVRKSQQVVCKISSSNAHVIFDFTRKRIVNVLHNIALVLIVIGSLVWAYVDIIPLEYIFFQERQ